MVKVGIIGVGTVSQMMHLPILSGLHDLYQITAVSDVSAGASDKWELKTVWGVGYKFEVRQ